MYKKTAGQQGGFSPLKKKKWEFKHLKKKNKNISPENIIKWIYSQMEGKDFGFVDVEWEEKGYFVIEKNRNWAFHGDEVLAEKKMFNGKVEADIFKIEKRAIKNVVWIVQMKEGAGFAFVIPKWWMFKSDIFIPWKDLLKAENKQIVNVEIIDFEGKNPRWKVTEILWKKGDLWLEVNSYIAETGFSQKFDEKLIENLEKKYSDNKKTPLLTREGLGESSRKDFRKMFTFTIDGEDAKDLDDAISIKKKENWSYKLFIHIADVAHYVEENSALDKEAFKRATSVYLADRVIPMLPEILSNNLCSLNIGSDKLCLTCEALLDKKWTLVKSTIYEGIIRSNFRLTYKEVDELVEWKIKVWDKLFCGLKCSKELIENIKLAEELKNKISNTKNISWVLNFDFPETKLILTSPPAPLLKGGEVSKNEIKLLEIKEYPRYNSNKMIEEFMVTANEAVSRKFSQFPFLYRIHETPLDESREKLIVLLNLFNINFKFKNFDTKEVWDLLNLINDNDKITNWQRKFLEKSILRTLSKAIYSEDNQGHFGLWVKFYSHFTSPIRRYPDLQIHRIIKEKLAWKLNTSRIVHYKKILPWVAKHCSDQERKAEKLEYKVRDYYICWYYKNKIWEKFEWVVTTVLPYWVFVQLPDTAEGFIELIPKNWKWEWWEYEELFMKFYNNSIKRKINLWDNLKVILDEVDMELLRINFKILY